MSRAGEVTTVRGGPPWPPPQLRLEDRIFFSAMVIREKFRQLLNMKPAGTPAGFKWKTSGTPDSKTD